MLMLSGTALKEGRVMPGASFVDPGSGAEINLWRFRQRVARVLAFLHERCAACRAFAEDLAAVKDDLDWAGALPRAVLPEEEDLAVPSLLDPGRRGTRRLLGEKAELPMVLVVDRYGAASSSFPAIGHRFSTGEEIAATVTHLALDCPECGVSHWPTSDER
jgi:predicted anti-sigma-YlaC factor YlaD